MGGIYFCTRGFLWRSFWGCVFLGGWGWGGGWGGGGGGGGGGAGGGGEGVVVGEVGRGSGMTFCVDGWRRAWRGGRRWVWWPVHRRWKASAGGKCGWEIML